MVRVSRDLAKVGWLVGLALLVSGAALAVGPTAVAKPQGAISLERAIDDAVRRGVLRREARTLQPCEPFQDERRVVYRGSDGMIRRYEAFGGSDDAYLVRRFYYAPSRALALAIITATAVNGAKYQYRIRYDASGRKQHERRRHLKGPGYPFPEVWPDAEVVRQPEQAFVADYACGGTP